MVADEDSILRDFKESESPASLRRLLLAHQHRIYSLCLQVLDRAEDAEDAAQEVLLKLAEGARSAGDADALRGWIYRVALRSSINALHRRRAIRHRESRSAMNPPDSPNFNDRERQALFEAIERLTEGERSLLLEHYFEKVPLADLGERRGLSAVAIWKRIDRAREKLKKLLLGAGFVAASDRVVEAMESSVPATAPAMLVGEALIGKILAGGLAVGTTKGSMVAVAAAMLLVGLALVGLMQFGAGHGSKPTRGQGGEISTVANPLAVAAAPATRDTPPASPEAKEETLREALQRYKAWMAGRKDAGERDPRRLARKEFKGARALILEDPATFLEFLRSPANDEVSDTLTGDLLLQIEERDGVQVLVRYPYGAFPLSLMEGVVDLLKTGPASQKRDILFFLVSVDDLPEALNLAISDLLQKSDSEVQYWAVHVLARAPLIPVIEERLMERCVFRGELDMKQVAIQVVSRSKNPQTRTWMIDQLAANRDSHMLAPWAEGAVTMALSGEAEHVERVAALLIGALKSDLHETYAERVLMSALRFPASQATRILQAVQYSSLAPKLVAAIAAVLDRIGRGQSAPQDLQSAFTSALRGH